MRHTISASELSDSPYPNTLDIARIQTLIDQGVDELIFPRPAGFGRRRREPLTYHWPGLAGPEPSCRERFAGTPPAPRLSLNLRQRALRIRLRGHILKFPDSDFLFELDESTLHIDLGGGVIHGGLKKTQVTDWVNLADKSTPIPVQDASIFAPGDNLQCSFIAANGSTGHNKCFINALDTVNNTITDWDYVEYGASDYGLVIPPGAYVSNGCTFSQGLLFEGSGRVTISNGSVIETRAYYASFRNTAAIPLEVQLRRVDFHGQFLDGLAFTGDRTGIGNVNARLTSCSLGRSYDIAKQGIIFISSGSLDVRRCFFQRSNTDPDETNVGHYYPLQGNLRFENCYFDGYNSNFEALRASDWESDADAIGLRSDHRHYIRDNALTLCQRNSAASIHFESCLARDYQRQLLLCQLLQGNPIQVGEVTVKDSLYGAGHPIFLALGDLTVTEDETLTPDEWLDLVQASEVGPVLFDKTLFDDVDTYCWASRVEQAPGVVTSFDAAQLSRLTALKNTLSRMVSFRGCAFERHRLGTDYARTLGEPEFHDTVLVNESGRDDFYIGRNHLSEPEDLLVSGSLRIVGGGVHSGGTSTNRATRPIRLRLGPGATFINGGNWAIREQGRGRIGAEQVYARWKARRVQYLEDQTRSVRRRALARIPGYADIE